MKKQIEQKVNELLNRTNSVSLPIDVREIARHCGYNVKNYSSYAKLIEQLELNEYANNHPAFSLKYNDAYYILVSDDLTVDLEHKVIAHEIGHIELHDLDESGIFGNSDDSKSKETFETEADEFALGLLAPLPILSNYSIKSHEDIRELTRLSVIDSCTVYSYLINYRDECCMIYDRNNLRERSLHKINRSDFKFRTTILILCVLSLLIALTTCISNFTRGGSQSAPGTISQSSIIQSTVEDSSVELDPTITYYWTESGTVYHSHENCRSLKNSTEIRSGTLSQAQTEKPRLCKFCEDKSN